MADSGRIAKQRAKVQALRAEEAAAEAALRDSRAELEQSYRELRRLVRRFISGGTVEASDRSDDPPSESNEDPLLTHLVEMSAMLRDLDAEYAETRDALVLIESLTVLETMLRRHTVIPRGILAGLRKAVISELGQVRVGPTKNRLQVLRQGVEDFRRVELVARYMQEGLSRPEAYKRVAEERGRATGASIDWPAIRASCDRFYKNGTNRDPHVRRLLIAEILLKRGDLLSVNQSVD
jgi:hypothetical protein